ncbi:hypothetical protein WAX78_05910 [Bacillus sp. FJAT-53711]|uniref:AlgX/AlgJ SGNH hydrolase-like domain-containing protein n=1 Tax=Bacillus yunxiaonensis TaxID=3127665 RepID=A0ABU8FSN5_9BACI
MKKCNNYMLITGFLLVIFGMCLWTGKVMYLDKKTFSSFENRNLAIDPVMTLDGLKSGKYFKDTELYFTDHIGARDLFIKTYTKLQIASRHTFINGIHVTNDKFLLYQPLQSNHMNEVDKGIDELTHLKNSFANTEFYFALVPSKQTALEYKFPSYVNRGYQQKHRDHFVQKMSKTDFPIIDLLPSFQQNFTKKDLERMYLTTDHHWNMEGAFYAYDYTMNYLASHSKKYKGAPVNKNDYEITWEKPTGKFVGSWNNQLYRLIDTSSVKIPYVYFKSDESWDDYTVYLGPKKEDTPKETMKEFFGKDKNIPDPGYGSVYQGDYDEINIINPKAQNNLHVVILKDSYADATYPLFAHNFAQTTFIDPRYPTGKSVQQQLAEQNADIVMFLYNDTNVFGDMFKFQTIK